MERGHQTTVAVIKTWIFGSFHAGRHLGFGTTGSRSIRFVIPENPALESNTKFIGRPVFSARQYAYMLSAVYAITRPSVRHTGVSYKNG